MVERSVDRFKKGRGTSPVLKNRSVDVQEGGSDIEVTD